MATSIPNLRVLDRSTAARELDLASELFHRIDRIIPEDQSVLTIPPGCRVRDAIALMRKHGYSQVAVVDNGEVLGEFSFRLFTPEVASAIIEGRTNRKCAPSNVVRTVPENCRRLKFENSGVEVS